MVRILFVDDDAALLRALSRVAKRAGYEIVTAESAAGALMVLGDEPTDVIVADYEMPTMNGVDLLRRVRERWPSVLRALMTGRTKQEIIGLDEGLVAIILEKPWLPGEVVEALRMLERSARARPS